MSHSDLKRLCTPSQGGAGGWTVLAPALVAFCAATAAACRDATAPTLPLEPVSIAVTALVTPTYLTDSAGRQLVECELPLQAHNTTSQRAIWLAATFAFFLPADSSSPFAVDTIPAAAIAASWGSDSLGPDSVKTARWQVSATVPYTLKILFSYQLTGGALATSEVPVSCEPPTAPGPPPTITTLTYQPDSLQPGDTLRLSYAATSSVGLWQTTIEVSGPCDTTLLVPEQLQHSASHVVALRMPARCGLGVPVGIFASTSDARLQVTSRSLTLPALVDHRPPVLQLSLKTPYSAWASPAGIATYLFAGDAVALDLEATDNHILHGIYWGVQPAGYVDSALVSDSAAGRSIALPTQASWVGPIQVRAYARDAAGNVTDTIISAAGGIQLFPTVGPSPTPVSVPGDIGDVAFDTKRNLIYLLQSNSDRIAVFSPATDTVVRTIPLSDYAGGFDLTPSGDSLILVFMNTQAIGVVDLTQASPVQTTISLAGLDSTYRLLDVRVTSTGQALFAGQHQVLGGVTRLYTYALPGGPLRERDDAPELGYNFPGMIERSGDRTAVIINGAAGAFVRYDATTDAFEAGQTARTQEVRPSVDGTAAHVSVLGDVYDPSLQYLRSMRVAPNSAGPGALSPDGQIHYIALDGVVRSRVADGSIIDRIAVPIVVNLLRVSPDGTTLVVVESYNYGPARVALVNLAQLH